MPFNETLAGRVRDCLEGETAIEKKMFGGLTFMVRGHMCCGVINDDLVVRVGPDAYDVAISLAHARPMDFTGKPLKGFVYVAARGCKTEKSLKSWVEHGLEFVKSLPPK